VVLVVNAKDVRFDVLLGREVVGAVAIKWWVGQPMPFEDYAKQKPEEARSEYRRWLQHQQLQQLSIWHASPTVVDDS
jgi:hypothetical protein